MNIYEKEKNENSRSYVLRVLTQNIIDFELPPGSLISENDISTKLNVSRTPVREAIIELSKQKLVTVMPQKGSFVSQLDFDLIEETRFMRLVLEKSIIELLCEQGLSDEYVLQLTLNLEKEKYYLEHEQRNQMLESDNEFHQLLFEAAHKIHIYEILKANMIHFDRLRSLTLQSIKDIKTVEDHITLVNALKKQDAIWACDILTKHLTRHQLEKDELIETHPNYFKA